MFGLRLGRLGGLFGGGVPGLPGTYYDFTSATLPSPWDTLRRAGTATYVDDAGLIVSASETSPGSGVYYPRQTHNPATLAPLGLLVEGQASQLAQSGVIGAAFVTQTKTVTAVAHTISFFGTGSITLSGTHSATVNGTAANVLTSYTFTPTAGSLTMTPSGTVVDGQLEVGTVATSRIPNTTTGTVVRTGDFAGGGITGSALTTLLDPAAPFTLILPFRKGYSSASVETLLGLCAGASAGGTNQLGIATQGNAVQIVHSGGSGPLVAGPFVGGELIANGDFAAGATNWNFGALYSVSGGVCTFAGGSDANLSYALPSFIVPGRTYQVSFSISYLVSGAISVRVGSASTNDYTAASTGAHSFLTVADSADAFLFRAQSSGGFAIDNISVREVTPLTLDGEAVNTVAVSVDPTAGKASISVNGSATTETTGIAYTGAGVTALVPGARDTSGGLPATAFTTPGIRVIAGEYKTGADLQALSTE